MNLLVILSNYFKHSIGIIFGIIWNLITFFQINYYHGFLFSRSDGDMLSHLTDLHNCALIKYNEFCLMAWILETFDTRYYILIFFSLTFLYLFYTLVKLSLWKLSLLVVGMIYSYLWCSQGSVYFFKSLSLYF